MNALIILNHKLNDEQENDLRQNWGVEEIVYQSAVDWANIDPTLSIRELRNYLRPLFGVIDDMSRGDDLIVVIAGEPTATFQVVENCQDYAQWLRDCDPKLICLSACTARQSVETVNADGSVTKTNVFKHVGFREYY